MSSTISKFLQPFRLSLADWWLARAHPDYGTYADTRLPLLQGSFPADDPEAVVFCGADPGYFGRFAVPLATSLAASSDSACFHMHFFGVPDKNAHKTAETISGLLGPGRFTMSFEDCDLSKWKRKDQIRYFMTVRFARLVDIAARTRRPFLALDIDALFLGPFDRMVQLCDGADIALRMRPSARNDSLKLHAGIVYLADTAAARAYLKRAVERMMLHLFHGPKDKFLDQRSLYRALAASNDIVVTDLNLRPEAFSSDSADSLIFFGRGDAKDNELPQIFSDRFGHAATTGDRVVE